MSSTFKTDDGLRLAYDDTGSGHPLLCLAGLSRNMADFEPVVANFASKARIIRLDSRGRGQSERDPNYANYNIFREAQDALGLLDHLGLEKASILGTSRGGLLAMAIAAGGADRLCGVILNDIGPIIEASGIEAIMGYLGRKPDYRSYDEAADRLSAAMASVGFAGVPKLAWRRHAMRLWTEESEALGLRYDPRLRDALVEQSATGGSADLWPWFEALAPLPVALIRGENSNLLSAETAEEMARRHPGLITAVVPDRGHVPFLDEPEAVAAIEAYLERVA